MEPVTMEAGPEIKQDNSSPLLDKKGLRYKEFSSNYKQIRSYTHRLIRSAPSVIREFNLLEQQVSELIKNAVKHGNKNEVRKKVRVWYKFNTKTVRLIVEDEGNGFKDLEKWNVFNRKRLECIENGNFEALGNYLSFRSAESDHRDGGNALFAALEYWNAGIVFNEKRNTMAVKRIFHKKKSTFKDTPAIPVSNGLGERDASAAMPVNSGVWETVTF
jgi:anti-sigma regulatory factor (Ser/Thr protein kinase)